VAGGRVFLMDYERKTGTIVNDASTRDELTGAERVLCLDVATGRVLWTHQYDRPYRVSFGGGPRCTPTVVGDRVYTLGAEGDLHCLEAASGKVRWHRSLTRDYGVETPVWGFAAHPLVDGDTLYTLAGQEGSVAIALDRRTGAEKWRSLSASGPGYSPPALIEHNGHRQLLVWHPEAINGLDPQTGKLIWTAPLKPAYGMSIMMPRYSAGHVFACGIGNAGLMLKLSDDARSVTEVWRGVAGNAFYCSTSTPFIAGDVVYGCDSRGQLVAASMADGKRLWSTGKPVSNSDQRTPNGTVFLVRHEERFFLFNESGELISARLTAAGYEETGRFRVLEPTSEVPPRKVVWSHPAFAARSLFARNDREIVCVDLAVP
jgi:outer membrane protein assembly factor BamB